MLKTYVPGPESDLLLAGWWAHLGASGELGQVFTTQYFNLSGFIAGFQYPTVLYYLADENGIWFAMWADPIMSGAFFGFWAREDKRGAPGQEHEIIAPAIESLRQFFTAWPVLFLVTRDAHIVEMAVRIGAHNLGQVPHVFDGEAAWIAYLERSEFTYLIQNPFPVSLEADGQGRQ